jgi:ABC-2 type transport system permease protein
MKQARRIAMWAEFKHTLRRMRGQIIGWGIGLALYGLMMVFFYESVAGMENLTEFLDAYPEEMLAFFDNMRAINTPQGYLDTYYFSLMHLIVGIFSIGACANLLAGDEEKGILDLVMAHPVSRTGLFLGRLLGYVAALGLILLASWLGWVLPAGSSGLDLTAIEFLRPFLPLLAVLLLFGTLALLFSMLVPAGRIAAMLSGALLVGNYLVRGLSGMNDALKPVVDYTPLHYYQGGNAVAGVEWAWLGALLAVSVLFSAGAWALFQRRDIRVGGERSWKLPRLAAVWKRG